MIKSKILFALCCSFVIQGCAVLDPYHRPERATFADDPSLTNAVEFAESTRDLYYDAIRDHTLFNRVSALALIGAGTASGVLGIRGDRSGQIAALGLSGAGLFGVNSVLYSQPRLGVYVAGARAVGCSLSQVGEARIATGAAFATSLEQLEKQHSVVAGLLLSGKTFSQSATQEARTALGVSGALISNIRLSGKRLYDSVQKIHAHVSAALVVSEPDLGALVQSLSGILSTRSNQITALSQFQFSPPGTPKGGPKALIKNDDQLLLAAVADLQQVISLFPSVVMGNTAAGSATDFSTCEEFAKVLPFRVLPQPSLTMAKGTVGKILVTGGQRPYAASWVGPVPDTAKVKLQEAPGKDGFLIDASGQGAATNLQVLILEADGQSVALPVMIQ